MAPRYDAHVETKIVELLRRMTLEEKIGQMVYLNFGYQEPLEAIREGRVGLIANVEDSDRMNRLQQIAVEETRLGIPLLFGNDVLHGFRTIFPIPLAEACSWEPDLWERTASLAAEEASMGGTQLIFGPMIDVTREPRWGRIAECPGEDPLLAGVFAEAKVRGFQEGPWDNRAAMTACVKHFVGYGAVEGGLDYNTVDISRQMLADIYLPPFRQAVEAGAGMVMTAFNDFNGVPVTANSYLQLEVLRKWLGFDGVIIGDDKTIAKLIPQGLAEDEVEACVKAVFAGTDMDMNSGIFANHLASLIQAGRVSENLIDQAVIRILRLKFIKKLFEYPYAPSKTPEFAETFSRKIRDAAREAAGKSIVLLKNSDGLLPLNPEIRSLAVIGPLAMEPNVLGCWSCYGEPADAITIFDGIREQAGPCIEVRYAKGCSVDGRERDGFAEAILLAQEADLAIVVVGETAGMSGEGMCRASLGLPGVQEELIQAVCATHTPVVAVQMNGRPIVSEWMNEHVSAIVESWFLGSEAGRAVADVLFGRVNPGGKLTVTFPRSVGQIPIYYNRKRTGRPDEVGKRFASKYQDLPSIPLYPFGYGLSYTQFAYHRLEVSPDKIGVSEMVTVKVEVENVGRRTGEEVVQLYLQDVAASVTRPVKELRGFRKIKLNPREIAVVEFILPGDSLGFYDGELNYRLEPGLFKVWAGPNSVEGPEGHFLLIG